jgi:2-oxoglutarate dehydrogenase E2 component (dihydrolipoamide succinyltransferase)
MVLVPLHGLANPAVVKTVKTPPLADSITEGTLSKWNKQVGEYVGKDEPIATIETDKVDITVNSTEAGVVTEHLAQEGENVQVGNDLVKIDTDGKPTAAAPKTEKKEAAQAPTPPPSPVQASPPVQAPAAPKPAPVQVSSPATVGDRGERRVKMNRMRLRISERLKEAQNTAASLTTFNEVDMTCVFFLMS